MAMRRHHLLDQHGELRALERRAFGRQRGELAHDVAAALRLLAQQLHVVGIGRVGPERALQLLRDDRDGRERRAELVRGRGREPVELREMLLAREHQLRRGQRVRHQTAFLGDLPRIGADEDDRHEVRNPDR